MMTDSVGNIPVNLVDAGDDLILHAALPGTEPENILISFTERSIVLHSTMRGMLASDKQPLLQEWHIGEYHREVLLPFAVSSARANATYNNGVLTISVPKGDRTAPREMRVKKIGPGRGQTRGHSGRG